MPRKGMRSLCFHSRTSSFSLSSPTSTPSRRSLISELAADQIIDAAAALIVKWDPDSSPYAKVTSLFYESKAEAREFIRRVNDLQKLMHFLSDDSASDSPWSSSSAEKLVVAQSLMQSAMKRLQKEFYQILSTNRAYLDPESVSTRSSRASARSSVSVDFDEEYEYDDVEVRTTGDSISEVEQVSATAMEELRLIAECMYSAGYAKECIGIYKIIRKSIIDEGIYRLGVEKLSSSQINKTDWEVLDHRIKNWLEAVKIAMRTLFNGERILCDHVFSASDSVRESCFGDISREGALLLFGFPEVLFSKGIKKSSWPPEMTFRALDMYNSIYEHWPEIESIFAFESTTVVRTQAYNSLIKIAEFVRAALADFETSLQKDSSKSLPRGGGIHRLTVGTMEFLSILADYSTVLADILHDMPPPPTSSLPESFFDASSGGSEESEDSHSSSSPAPPPPISVRVAWLILVLLCKLDGKAKRYDGVAVSYLFLANNLQYVVTRVRSSNLVYILGEDWCDKHDRKVLRFAANYERLAWGKVIASLPGGNPTAEFSPEEARIVFRSFNASFEEAMKKQRSSVIPDRKLRDGIKVSLCKKIVQVYKQFYDKNRYQVSRVYVKFTPEDVGNYLSDLFYDTTAFEEEIRSFPASTLSSASSEASSPSSSARRLHWRIR